jgi:hypothetical protein
MLFYTLHKKANAYSKSVTTRKLCQFFSHCWQSLEHTIYLRKLGEVGAENERPRRGSDRGWVDKKTSSSLLF